MSSRRGSVVCSFLVPHRCRPFPALSLRCFCVFFVCLYLHEGEEGGSSTRQAMSHAPRPPLPPNQAPFPPRPTPTPTPPRSPPPSFPSPPPSFPYYFTHATMRRTTKNAKDGQAKRKGGKGSPSPNPPAPSVASRCCCCSPLLTDVHYSLFALIAQIR